MVEAAFKKSTFREYFESLVITVILALFGTTFIVQAFKIPTPSMEDNLLVGDHLLVNKFVFGARGSMLDSVLPFKDIKRGDVIVFKYPKDLTKHYVKRAIGLPGDHVKIVDKQVFVNGVALNEPYKIHKSLPGSYADPFRDFFPPKPHPGRVYRDIDGDLYWYEDYTKDGEIIVPAGQYFAMGDNRDNSADSRYWGFVPRALIVGKGLIIYWSYETDSDEYRRTEVRDRVQQITDLATNFFTKTRWSRTFKIIR
ncbi:MAG: signal peptidase I [Acidobacteria bacterium]|nr:MAG: signal peptidase I [Acidobacteriota bacterium]